MKLGQTSILNFTSKVVAQAIGFLSLAFLSRRLGANIIGTYTLLIGLSTWVQFAGTLGVSEAVGKRISEQKNPHEMFWAGILLAVLPTALIISVIYIFEENITSYIGEKEIIVLFILVCVLNIMQSHINSSLIGYHKVDIYSITSPINSGLRGTTQILLTILGFQFVGMVWGWIIAVAATICVSIYFLPFKFKLPSKSHFVSIYEYAKFSWLGGVRSRTFSHIDILILGFFVQNTLVGVYTVAWSIARFLNAFSSSLSTTLFPKMSELSKESEHNEIQTHIQNSLVYSGILIIPGLFGSLLIGEEVLGLFGSEFTKGHHILPVLVLAMLFYSYYIQLSNSLNASDHPNLAFQANFVFILLNIILNVFLITTIGWIGAPIASAISSAFAGLTAYIQINSVISITIPIQDLFNQIVSSLCMSVIVYTMSHIKFLTQSNMLFVLISIIFGGSFYFLALYMLSDKFRKTIRNNLTTQVLYQTSSD